MSSRITRSSARQAASQAAHQVGSLDSSPAGTLSTPTIPGPTSQVDRKRKVSSSSTHDKSSTPLAAPYPAISGRRSKRQKIAEPISKGTQDNFNSPFQGARRKGKATADMDGNEYVESGDTTLLSTRFIEFV